MKRQTSPLAAGLLAFVGFAVILVLATVAAFMTLFFQSLAGFGKAPCHSCINVGSFTNETVAILGVGLFLASIAFWAIFKSMRPQQKQHKK
jgi:hypothetical protein